MNQTISRRKAEKNDMLYARKCNYLDMKQLDKNKIGDARGTGPIGEVEMVE